jgi:hypothetical protein
MNLKLPFPATNSHLPANWIRNDYENTEQKISSADYMSMEMVILLPKTYF